MRSEAQGQLDVEICRSFVAAVRGELVTAEFAGPLDRPPLQRGADALPTSIFLYGEGVDFRFGELGAVQGERRAVPLWSNGLNAEPQETHNSLFLNGYAQVAGEVPGVVADHERKLLRRDLLQASKKLSPARMFLIPFLDREGCLLCFVHCPPFPTDFRRELVERAGGKSFPSLELQDALQPAQHPVHIRKVLALQRIGERGIRAGNAKDRGLDVFDGAFGDLCG